MEIFCFKTKKGITPASSSTKLSVFSKQLFKIFLFLSVSMGMRMLLAAQDLPFVVLLLPWFLVHPFAIKIILLYLPCLIE